MIRLRIVAEGHSEERFCKRILIPYLANFNVFASVSKIETSSSRKRPDIRFKGGLPSYKHLRKDILNYLQCDKSSDLRVTSFVDFFHLPSDFPGIMTKPNADKDVQIGHLEEALADDIHDARFISYIQKHEFETFLFVDIRCLRKLYPEHLSKIGRIAKEAEGLSPEEVNGGDLTSPSNRIIAEIPEHRSNKPNAVSVLENIGLPTIRCRCPHFDAWVSRLETLATLQ